MPRQLNAPFEALQAGTISIRDSLLERTIAAFQAQKNDAPRDAGTSGCWSDHGWDGNLRPLVSALEQGNLAAVRTMFQSLFQTSLSYGIAMGAQELAAVQSTPRHTETYEHQWRQTLISVAEAVGAIPVHNPELGPDHRQLPVGTVFSALSSKMGVSVDFPQGFGVFGCRPADCIMPTIALQHLHAAWYCAQWLQRDGKRVVEIGGGFGGLFYYLSKLRRVDYCSYDVPAAIAIQTVFIGASCPAIQLQLYGEAKPSEGGAVARLLPSWVLGQSEARVAQEPVDLIINQDTIADLAQETREQILTYMGTVLQGALISIAPDSSAVSDCLLFPAALAEAGFHLFDRVPFHSRNGYMREIYHPPRHDGTRLP